MLCNRDRSFGFEEALTFTPRYQLGRDDTSNARFLDEEERWWVVIQAWRWRCARANLGDRQNGGAATRYRSRFRRKGGIASAEEGVGTLIHLRLGHSIVDLQLVITCYVRGLVAGSHYLSIHREFINYYNNQIIGYSFNWNNSNIVISGILKL